MSEEIPFADLDYQSKIDKIYHISDIHIRLQKRHDEYRKVFNNLYQSLKTEVVDGLGGDSKKGLIVITGDILHSKTELSPECVSITADFFQNLARQLIDGHAQKRQWVFALCSLNQLCKRLHK